MCQTLPVFLPHQVQPLDRKLLARLQMQASPNSPGFGALAEFATAEDSSSLSDRASTLASASVRPTLTSSASLPHLSLLLSHQHQQSQSTWLSQASSVSGTIASSSIAVGSQQRPFPWKSNSDVSGYSQQPSMMHKSASASDITHATERSVRRGIPTNQRSSIAQMWDSGAHVEGTSTELASLTEDHLVSVGEVSLFWRGPLFCVL